MHIERRWCCLALTSVFGLLTAAVSATPPAAYDPNWHVNAEPPLIKLAPVIGVGPLLDPPTPVVSIAVRVPATAKPGEELEYHICLENQSFAAAHHVIVRNPLPPHARYVRAKPAPTAREPELVWELGTLDACAKYEILLVLSPTGTGDVKNCARVQFEHGQCVCTKVPKPRSACKTGPAAGVVNETLTYRLTVTKTRRGDAHDVKLTDTVPAGLEHASGKKQSLEPWDARIWAKPNRRISSRRHGAGALQSGGCRGRGGLHRSRKLRHRG